MQILTFCEIRHRYKEKYKKILDGSNERLKRKLEGYQVFQDRRNYFIKVSDKQKEAEKIVNLLILQDKAFHEKDVKKKYELLLQTLPEEYWQMFSETIGLHRTYTMHLINNRKNKSTEMLHVFQGLKTMLSLMDKEISKYSDIEVVELIKNKKFTSTAKQYTVWFLKYIYKKEPERFSFDVEVNILRKERLKGEEDYYTPEEWNDFVDIFFDYNRHMDHAYADCTYARYWLYVLLHLSLAWRKSDILNLPALENLLDISEYTLDWFTIHTFTDVDAQKIINQAKLSAEQYLTKKTGARKHFNIPRQALIPTAVALIICEQWRQKQGDKMLFGKFYVKTTKITEMFELKKDFLSLKANRTLLSMFNEKASENSELSKEAGYLTSYMRSHKTSKLGHANTTTVYLHSTYDERERITMGKQMIDRGAFGFVYDSLLEAAGERQGIFKKNTELIARINDGITPLNAEDISGTIYSIATEREMLLEEIYSWDKDEVNEKIMYLFSGKLLSRMDDVFCLMNGRCPYPTEDKCMMCRYSIPTTFSLMMVGEELERLLIEIGRTRKEDKIDRVNLTFQIGKLVMIIKEGIDRFGCEYIKTYINYKKINELIKKEAPNMIFLEELQNDRK